MSRKSKFKPITAEELTFKDVPWTQGPWGIGPKPLGHCRIYAPSEVHAIARTYGPTLNNVGVCQLTGPRNYADAALISLAPAMADVIGLLYEAQTALYASDRARSEQYHSRARSLAIRIRLQIFCLLEPEKGAMK